MKILIGVLLPFWLVAQSYSLGNLIDSAKKHNKRIESKGLTLSAKQKEVDSAKSAYWPTVDVGLSHTMITPNSIVSPGQTTTGVATASWSLYDGGRKEALLQSKAFEYEASLFEQRAFGKSITLEIIRHYYTIQKLTSTLNALRERAGELTAQIKRIKKFEEAGLSTGEEVDKLQSVYENNAYIIANAQLALATSQDNLSLLSGVSAKSLKQSYLLSPSQNLRFQTLDAIKTLEAKANAIGENANAINAGYRPQVNVSDTYMKANYDDLASIPNAGSFLVDHQNKLMVSVNMRLFDNGTMSKQSEAVRLQEMALMGEVDYAIKEQKMNYALSKKGLNTLYSKLKSAKSALKSATSTYHSVKQKFEAGILDNIAYLDALTQKTQAQAQYKETLYDLEIAKSISYYYAGKDPKEFIR